MLVEICLISKKQNASRVYHKPMNAFLCYRYCILQRPNPLTESFLTGVFTCGPCPLYAIKQGQVNKPFDGAFIFSEVNADQIHWKPAPDGGYVKFKAKPDK